MLKQEFLVALGGYLLVRPATVRGEIDFSREVRPILSSKCAHCHGPDEGNREGEFRVDTEAGAFADLGGHFAFVPGRPGESEAIRRISSSDPAPDVQRILIPREA